MIDRRQGLMTDTGEARRKGDKVFGFILGILLVFLLNWLMGCTQATVRESAALKNHTLDCRVEPSDFRCQVYMPEDDGVAETAEKIAEDLESDFEEGL